MHVVCYVMLVGSCGCIVNSVLSVMGGGTLVYGMGVVLVKWKWLKTFRAH